MKRFVKHRTQDKELDIVQSNIQKVFEQLENDSTDPNVGIGKSFKIIKGVIGVAADYTKFRHFLGKVPTAVILIRVQPNVAPPQPFSYVETVRNSEVIEIFSGSDCIVDFLIY